MVSFIHRPFQTRTYRLPTKLLAAPLHFSTTPDDLLHPHPHARCNACGQWDQTPEGAAEDPPKHDDRKWNGNAQSHGALFQLFKHWFERDGRRGVEEDIRLLAANGDIRRGALCYGIRRRRDILLFSILVQILIGARLMIGRSPQIGIGDCQPGILDRFHGAPVQILDADVFAGSWICDGARLGFGSLARLMLHHIARLLLAAIFALFFVLLGLLFPRAVVRVNLLVSVFFVGVEMLDELLHRRNGVARAPMLADMVRLRCAGFRGSGGHAGSRLRWLVKDGR